MRSPRSPKNQNNTKIKTSFQDYSSSQDMNNSNIDTKNARLRNIVNNTIKCTFKLIL